MVEKSQVQQVVEEFLQGATSFLVDVVVDEKSKSVMVEIDDDEAVSIDYCVEISQLISAKLPEMDDYDLQVSSAGLTSPFKMLRQYKKYIGNEVEVLTKTGEKLQGILNSADEEKFVVEYTQMIKPEGEKKKRKVTVTREFNYSEIKYTKNIIRFK